MPGALWTVRALVLPPVRPCVEPALPSLPHVMAVLARFMAILVSFAGEGRRKIALYMVLPAIVTGPFAVFPAKVAFALELVRTRPPASRIFAASMAGFLAKAAPFPAISKAFPAFPWSCRETLAEAGTGLQVRAAFMAVTALVSPFAILSIIAAVPRATGRPVVSFAGKSVPFATIALRTAGKIPLVFDKMLALWGKALTPVETAFKVRITRISIVRLPVPGSLEPCAFIPVVAAVLVGITALIAGKATLVTGRARATFPMVPLLPASEGLASGTPAPVVETSPAPATALTGLVMGSVLLPSILPFTFLVSAAPGFCARPEFALPGLAPAQSPVRLLRIVVAALEALVVLLCRGHGFPVCLQQKTPESVG